MSSYFYQGEVPFVSGQTHDTIDSNKQPRESATGQQSPEDPEINQPDGRSRREDQFYVSPFAMSCHPKTSCRFPGQGQFPKSEHSQSPLIVDMLEEDITELRPEVITGLDAFLENDFIPPIKLDNSNVMSPLISSTYHQYAHSDLHSNMSHSLKWQLSTQRTLDSAQHWQTVYNPLSQNVSLAKDRYTDETRKYICETFATATEQQSDTFPYQEKNIRHCHNAAISDVNQKKLDVIGNFENKNQPESLLKLLWSDDDHGTDSNATRDFPTKLSFPAGQDTFPPKSKSPAGEFQCDSDSNVDQKLTFHESMYYSSVKNNTSSSVFCCSSGSPFKNSVPFQSPRSFPNHLEKYVSAQQFQQSVEGLRHAINSDCINNGPNIRGQKESSELKLIGNQVLCEQRQVQPKKPSDTYVSMIAKAMLSNGLKGMTLSDLYSKIEELFPYYKTSTITWRNAVRHNLSINDCFIKISRASNHRGYYWTLHPRCVEIFRSGKYKRGDARRLLQSLRQTESFYTLPRISVLQSKN